MTDEESNKLDFYDKLTHQLLDTEHTDTDYSTMYGIVEGIYEDGHSIILNDEAEDTESRLSHIETKLEEITMILRGMESQ